MKKYYKENLRTKNVNFIYKCIAELQKFTSKIFNFYSTFFSIFLTIQPLKDFVATLSSILNSMLMTRGHHEPVFQH